MSDGWVCPVCGRGLSPYIIECPCYKERQNIATLTTTDTLQKPNVSTATISILPEKGGTSKTFKGMLWYI